MGQDRSRAAAAGQDAINFSDLDPETASKLKAEHYSVLGQNIQQTYHQQLHENRQRTALSAQQAAYGQPLAKLPQTQPAPYRSAAPATPIDSFPRSTPATVAGHQPPQTFLPPVHITPPQHPYTAGYAGPPVPGNRHGSQNFAPQANPRRAAVAYRQQPTAARQQSTQGVAPPQRPVGPQTVQDDSHVFLQDRIANALTRRFKRDDSDSDRDNSAPAPATDAAGFDTPVATSVTEEVAHSVMEFATDLEPEITIEPAPPKARTIKVRRAKPQSDIVFNDHSPKPLQTSLKDVPTPVRESFDDQYSYSEILQSNQYAAEVNGLQRPQDRPADHELNPPSTHRNSRTAPARRSVQPAIHHDDQDQTFDVILEDHDDSLLDRYQTIRQTSAQHGQHDHHDHHVDPAVELPVVKKPANRKPVARSTNGKTTAKPRVAAMPRPDRYGTSDRRTSAENVSVFLPQQDDDFSPSPDDNGFRPRQNFDTDSPQDRDIDPQDRPNRGPIRRDDLRDAGPQLDRKDRRTRDRVRSRLDDELDLDTLDSDLDDELEDDDFVDDRPVRTPQKSCREYQAELITGSIRDISLDISPPAANEGAQYGGLARTWTDRSGNILATGALVDLRRGYVILDSGQKLAYARLSESDLAAVSEFWRLPEVCVIGTSGGSPYRSWTPQAVTWKASNLCHKPLFFENVQLERYGHSRGPIAQPIHSTLHFFVSLVSVPYNTAISPPTECEYALGYYRPGNCAPWLKDPVPISLQGIRREALFVTGAAFIP